MKNVIPKEFLDNYNNLVETFQSELNQLKDLLGLRLKQLKRIEGTRARIVVTPKILSEFVKHSGRQNGSAKRRWILDSY
jgi:hypothetical protein